VRRAHRTRSPTEVESGKASPSSWRGRLHLAAGGADELVSEIEAPGGEGADRVGEGLPWLLAVGTESASQIEATGGIVDRGGPPGFSSGLRWPSTRAGRKGARGKRMMAAPTCDGEGDRALVRESDE
jgi:hypothetical protein